MLQNTAMAQSVANLAIAQVDHPAKLSAQSVWHALITAGVYFIDSPILVWAGIAVLAVVLIVPTFRKGYIIEVPEGHLRVPVFDREEHERKQREQLDGGVFGDICNPTSMSALALFPDDD
ncbi:hypothetical protein HAP94_10965 [Acidithiobacillus ferrivorans]|nr:hypothetical protein [Acidithiobacillus ferrivorans]